MAAQSDLLDTTSKTWVSGTRAKNEWEKLKSDLASLLEEYTKFSAAVSKANIRVLESKFNKATPMGKSLIAQDIQEVMDKRYMEKRYNTIVAIEAAGCTPSPGLIRLISPRQSTKVISSLRISKDDTPSNDVSNIAAKYYTTLYATKPTIPTAQRKCLNAIQTTLTSTDRQSLESPLSTEELHKALAAMKNGKSPGMDGLTAEAYKIWPILVDILKEVWDQCVVESRLHDSARTGLITIIHKKDDETLVTNYRPITLSNIDYKIIAKAYATRLAKVVGSVVDASQTGFIPERDIRSNILEAQYVLNKIKKQQKGAVLLLDFEKAYDRVNRDFLWLVLEAMGFGPSFIQAMKTLHNDSKGKVIVNNIISEAFQVMGGVKQGCPIAPLLFALASQPLNSLLKTGAGVYYAGDNRCVGMYADDTTVFIRDVADIYKALDILQVYEEASGAKLNVNKSSCLTPSSGNAPIPTATQDRLLGYQISLDGWNTLQWSSKAKELTNIASKWAVAKIDILSKADAVKMYLVSKLQYLANFSLPDKTQVSILRKAITRATFRSAPRIAYEKALRPKKKGGLGIPDLELRCMATIATWVCRRADNPSWAPIFDKELEHLKANGVNVDRALPDKRLLGSGLVGQAWYTFSKIKKKGTPSKSVKANYTKLLGNSPECEIFGAPPKSPNRWKWLTIQPIQAKLTDLRWRAWHLKLKTKKGVDFHNTSCPWCGKVCQGAHILRDCQFALSCREAIEAKGIPCPTTSQWVDDWISDEVFNRSIIATKDIIMSTLKWALWKAYCKAVYGKDISGPNTILSMFYTKLEETKHAFKASQSSKNLYHKEVKQLAKGIFKNLSAITM